jgi:hypothetical protein
MKIPMGTSFASDRRFGVRAVWPSGPRGTTASLRQCSGVSPEEEDSWANRAVRSASG